MTRLRLVRLYLGIDQETVARQLGVDRSFISRLEHGHRRVPENRRYQLAEVLNVPEPLLFG